VRPLIKGDTTAGPAIIAKLRNRFAATVRPCAELLPRRDRNDAEMTPARRAAAAAWAVWAAVDE